MSLPPEAMPGPEPGVPGEADLPMADPGDETAASALPPVDAAAPEDPDAGPRPSTFVLPLAALGFALFALRWAGRAWVQAPDLWWDPLLAILGGGAAAAYAIHQRNRMLAGLRGLVSELSIGAGARAPALAPGADNAEGSGEAVALMPGAEDAAAGAAASAVLDAAGGAAEDDRGTGSDPAPHPDASGASTPTGAGGGSRGAEAGGADGPAPARWLDDLRRGWREDDGAAWLPSLDAVAPGRLTASLVLGMLALGFAIVAQRGLDQLAQQLGDRVPQVGWPLGLLLLAVIALSCAGAYLAPEQVEDAPLAPRMLRSIGGRRAWLWASLGAGLCLVTVAFPAGAGVDPPPFAILRHAADFNNATLQPVGLFQWLLGLGIVLLALAVPPKPVLERLGAALAALRRPHAWLLLLILALGAWLRFRLLADVPAEMTSDHTEKLKDVLTMLDGGLRPVFLPGNAGREAMEFYWLAFLMGPLGLPVSFQTMKVGMGLVSLLNVLMIYLLARELGGRALGLLAALALALAPWHLLITRIALRIAFAPLWVTIVAWLLLRALRSGHRNDFLALGAAAALGLYGYTAYRPFLLLLPILVGAKLLHDAWRARARGLPRWPAGLLPHLAAAGLVALILTLPLLRYARDYRGEFNHRSVTRLVGDAPLAGAEFDRVLQQNLRQQLRPNIVRALTMFNISSDSAWFQSPPGRPALDTIAGALLLLGLGTLLARRRDWRSLALAASIPFLLSTSFLAIAFPRENPSLSRASGSLPLVLLLAVLPLPGLIARARESFGRMGLVWSTTLVLLLFGGMARVGYLRYFVEYRQVYDNSTHNTSEGAQAVRDFLDQPGTDIQHVYYVGWENGWDYRALAFHLGEPGWNGLIAGTEPDWSDAAEGAKAHVGDPAPMLYLVGGPHADRQIDILRGYFPQAQVQEHPSRRVAGKNFWTVTVPAGQEAAP